MHSAVAVANFFVVRAQRESVRDMIAQKLHDLVYLAHGWRLGVVGKPMISTPVNAHRDGVFAPELREAGAWGNRRIDQLIAVTRIDEKRGMMVEQTPEVPPSDPAVPTLEWIWKAYGKQEPFEVSRVTRHAGGPWDLIWNDEERTDDEAKLIPNGTMRLWFREEAAKRRAAQPTAPMPSKKLEQTQQLLARPDPDRLRNV